MQIKIQEDWLARADQLARSFKDSGIKMLPGGLAGIKVNLEEYGKSEGGILMPKNEHENSHINLAMVTQIAEDDESEVEFEVGDFIQYAENAVTFDSPALIKKITGVKVEEKESFRCSVQDVERIIPRKVIL